MYIFLNSRSDKPLYDGEVEKVRPFLIEDNDSAPIPGSTNKIPLPRGGLDFVTSEQMSNSMPEGYDDEYDMGSDSEEMVI